MINFTLIIYHEPAGYDKSLYGISQYCHIPLNENSLWHIYIVKNGFQRRRAHGETGDPPDTHRNQFHPQYFRSHEADPDLCHIPDSFRMRADLHPFTLHTPSIQRFSTLISARKQRRPLVVQRASFYLNAYWSFSRRASISLSFSSKTLHASSTGEDVVISTPAFLSTSIG